MDEAAINAMDKEMLVLQIKLLKAQLKMNRSSLSESIKEMNNFIEEKQGSDSLIVPIDKKNNPWVEKKSCAVM